jgi:hypothetical protein
MRGLKMYSLTLLTLITLACGGEETGVGGSDNLLIAKASETTQQTTPSPSPSPSNHGGGAHAHNHNASMMPKIDTSKIPTQAVGFSAPRIQANVASPKQNSNGTGQFRFTCDFSHMSFNDPIVFPSQQGAAHLHVFFGNTAVDHNTTQESIKSVGNSTCAGGTVNRTGYWIPAVVDTKDGTPLKPNKILVYYKSDATGSANIKPYPAGLRMISGDMNSSGPQSHTDFGCLGPNGEEKRYKNIPADCAIGWTLEITIDFPMCWDGVNLDSPDHKSHMSFTMWDNNIRKNVCPASHPVNLPGVTEKIQYQVTEDGATSRWRLSSDNYSAVLPGGFSIHADWYNGWDPEVQNTWITNCLKAERDCHGYLLGDGTTLF